MSEEYSIMDSGYISWIYTVIFFFHLSVNGHLSCLYLLDIVNHASVNLGMQISL